MDPESVRASRSYRPPDLDRHAPSSSSSTYSSWEISFSPLPPAFLLHLLPPSTHVPPHTLVFLILLLLLIVILLIFLMLCLLLLLYILAPLHTLLPILLVLFLFCLIVVTAVLISLPLCGAMFCVAMLCDSMLHYAMPRHAMTCYALPCSSTPCYAVLFYASSASGPWKAEATTTTTRRTGPSRPQWDRLTSWPQWDPVGRGQRSSRPQWDREHGGGHGGAELPAPEARLGAGPPLARQLGAQI